MTRNSSERSDATETTAPSAATDVADSAATTQNPGPSGETKNAPAAVDLDFDQVFDALRNRRRRDVLEYLLAGDGTGTLGDLAEHIAAFENDTTVEAISADQRKRVYVGLYQCHLPKLDDLDVIDYDSDRGDVSLGPNAPRLYPYLPDAEIDVDGDGDGDRPWDLVYLGYGVAGLGVLSAAVGLGLATGGEALLIAVAAMGGLCAIALGHVVSRRR